MDGECYLLCNAMCVVCQAIACLGKSFWVLAVRGAHHFGLFLQLHFHRELHSNVYMQDFMQHCIMTNFIAHVLQAILQ